MEPQQNSPFTANVPEVPTNTPLPPNNPLPPSQPKKSRIVLWASLGGVFLIILLVGGYFGVQLLAASNVKQNSAKQHHDVPKSANSNDTSTTPSQVNQGEEIPMTQSIVISDKTLVTVDLPSGWGSITTSGQSTSAANTSKGSVITYGVLDMRTQYDPGADNQEASLNAMNMINVVLNGRAIDQNVAEIRKKDVTAKTTDQKNLVLSYKWFEYTDKAKTPQRTEVAIRASGQKYIIIFYTSPIKTVSEFDKILESVKIGGIS